MKRLALILGTLLTLLAMTAVSPAPASAATFRDWPVQSQGAVGSQVTTLQYLLTAHGHATAADGSFGPATRAQVLAFQRANGLAQDGFVGPATWARLTSIVLHEGSTGSAVKALQVQLRRRGQNVAVDGSFGPATKAAVLARQKADGIAQDASVGPQTWRALVAGVVTSSGPTSKPTTNPTAPGSRAGLAKAILADSGINPLRWCGPAYSSPGQNLRDTANGGTAWTGGGDVGQRAVYLNVHMLTFMRNYGLRHNYRITAIAGCDHSATSEHYKGNAVDVDMIDGSPVRLTGSGRTVADAMMAACRAAGAYQVFGPSNRPEDHSTHVHCGWH